MANIVRKKVEIFDKPIIKYWACIDYHMSCCHDDINGVDIFRVRCLERHTSPGLDYGILSDRPDRVSYKIHADDVPSHKCLHDGLLFYTQLFDTKKAARSDVLETFARHKERILSIVRGYMLDHAKMEELEDSFKASPKGRAYCTHGDRNEKY